MSILQIKQWDGDDGHRWARNKDWLDRMVEPFGTAALQAADVKTGESCLDIGCGSGATTLALADRAGGNGRILGVDVSSALIALAKQARTGGDHPQYLLADAGSADWRGEGFDLLFSRFGVMFFDDPAAAFSNLRQRLKTGGRMAFVCWRSVGENEWTSLPVNALRDLFPLPSSPPGYAPGPYSLARRDFLETVLGDAGFRDIAIRPFDHDIVFAEGDTPTDAARHATQMAMEVGPVSRLLAGCDDGVIGQVKEALTAAFAQRVKGTTIPLAGAAWLVTAAN